MTSKKDLEVRIAALEAEVALLKARPVTVPAYPVYPTYPHPNDWYPFGYPKIWCGTSTSTKIGNGLLSGYRQGLDTKKEGD